MKTPLTFAALWKQVKKLFVLWLVLALVVALAVAGIHFTSLSDRSTVTAVVNFGFDGIELGHDPNGNWFDVTAMKSEDVIVAAAAAAGLTLAEGDVEKITSHLYIEGYVPDTVVDDITTLTSSYSEETLSASSARKMDAYYPTTYTLRLNFGSLGYTPEQGNALMQGVLDAYVEKFYASYGYNGALEKALLSEDYSAYDYSAAVTALDVNLEILERYVQAMAAEDTTGFRSSVTGLTFQDLLSGVQTLRNQDVKQLSSYIASNNVSNDPDLQTSQYHYEIEEAKREVTGLQERIASLSEIIGGYAKTKGVVVGASTMTTTTSAGAATGTAESGEAGAGTTGTQTDTISTAYEVTQSSEMYDSLITQRVDLRTEMAEVNARIVQYESLIANMDKGSPEEAMNRADEDFSAVQQRLTSLMENIRKTAEDYYNENKLAGAFRVISFSAASSFPVRRLLSASLLDILAAEAVLFGIFLLVAVIRAGGSGRRERKTARTAGQTA